MINYDLIIVGGGPAGIAASIYAARYSLKFILITDALGGWLNQIHKIENYPGYASISGFELLQKFKEQLDFLKVLIENGKVVIMRFDHNGKKFEIKTDTGKQYIAKTIIISSGSHKKELGIFGEKKFLGKGVSYCAICDGAFFRNKKVAVIGGANSAMTAALLLAEHAESVHLIFRKDKLAGSNDLIKSVKKHKKILLVESTLVESVNGNNKVDSLSLSKRDGRRTELKVDGVFIEIGYVPTVNFLEQMGVSFDLERQIIIDEKGRTNIDGIFAAGDVTNGQGGIKQLITAAAGGCIAAASVNEYIKKLK